jgi:outer membrane protein
MERMNKHYNTASKNAKYDMQQELSTRNQQINNFREANLERIGKKRAQMMDGVYQKINVYLDEYGKSHHYDLILGTVQGGSILYGSSGVDITDDIIKGLNKRYE